MMKFNALINMPLMQYIDYHKKMNPYLTKNEKKVLKLLVEDAKILDKDICKKLKISAQAVGKMRKKLEESFIHKYDLELKFEMLGINVFAIAFIKVKSKGWNLIMGSSKKDIINSNMIGVYNVHDGMTNFIIYYGFKNFLEVDSYFHRMKKDLCDYFEVIKLCVYSTNGIVYNSPKKLFDWAIDNYGNNESSKIRIFDEKYRNDDFYRPTNSRWNLKQNEKEVLKMLLKNCRITNSEMSRCNSLTPRGTGKIHSRLKKKGLIKSYRTLLDFKTMGLNAFLIFLMRHIEEKDDEKNDRNSRLEEFVATCPNLVSCFRVHHGNATHICLCGFQNLVQVDDYLNAFEQKFYKNFEITQSFIFASSGLWRHTNEHLFFKALDEMEKSEQLYTNF